MRRLAQVQIAHHQPTKAVPIEGPVRVEDQLFASDEDIGRDHEAKVMTGSICARAFRPSPSRKRARNSGVGSMQLSCLPNRR
jgi:hypothetical protein